MATLSLNDKAPKFEGKAGFSLANADFELGAGDKYDTEDAIVISAAMVHPWITVTFPEAPTGPAADYDVNDPHDNPAADHLSPYATPEVKEAADNADAVIQNEAYPNNAAADDADVADAALEESKIAKTTPTVAAATPAANPAVSATTTPGATS